MTPEDDALLFEIEEQMGSDLPDWLLGMVLKGIPIEAVLGFVTSHISENRAAIS